MSSTHNEIMKPRTRQQRQTTTTTNNVDDDKFARQFGPIQQTLQLCSNIASSFNFT